MGRKPSIDWQDETKLDDSESASDFASLSKRPQAMDSFFVEEEDSGDFAAMLDAAEASHEEEHEGFTPGETVTGTVHSVGEEVLLDLGAKWVGVLSAADAKEIAGKKPGVGEALRATVVEVRGHEVFLGSKLSASLQGKQDLELAQSSKTPVRGKVSAHNKGGFDVVILGKKAFCPVSQMDTKYVDDPSSYVGRELEFLVERTSGRDVVVSRAALLRRQQADALQKIASDFAENPQKVIEGTVSSQRDFGVFVDIGHGIKGLVHISEISHGRVDTVGTYVTLGDRVFVKILSIDSQGERPKIALSMKAASQDPWDQVSENFTLDKTYGGKVVRLTDFGAFVELKPGLEGLLHISEMSWVKRLRHPRDLLEVGQAVQVRLLDIDAEARRLSLSLKSPEDDPWSQFHSRHEVGSKFFAKVESLKSYGAILGLAEGLSGLLPISAIKRAFGESYRKGVRPGLEIEVAIREVNEEDRKILLTLPTLDEDEDDRLAYREYLAAEARKQDAMLEQSETAKVGSFGALLAAQLQKK